MSTADNNLLTFLKKNSLFTNSPTKNGSRKSKSKSRSKDKMTESKMTPTKPREPFFEDYKPRTYVPPEQLAPLESNNNARFAPPLANNLRQGLPLHDSRFNSL
jgi:hypothetical protein